MTSYLYCYARLHIGMLVNGHFITFWCFLVLENAPDVLIHFQTLKICIFTGKIVQWSVPGLFHTKVWGKLYNCGNLKQQNNNYISKDSNTNNSRWYAKLQTIISTVRSSRHHLSKRWMLVLSGDWGPCKLWLQKT